MRISRTILLIPMWSAMFISSFSSSSTEKDKFSSAYTALNDPNALAPENDELTAQSLLVIIAFEHRTAIDFIEDYPEWVQGSLALQKEFDKKFRFPSYVGAKRKFLEALLESGFCSRKLFTVFLQIMREGSAGDRHIVNELLKIISLHGGASRVKLESLELLKIVELSSLDYFSKMDLYRVFDYSADRVIAELADTIIANEEGLVEKGANRRYAPVKMRAEYLMGVQRTSRDRVVENILKRAEPHDKVLANIFSDNVVAEELFAQWLYDLKGRNALPLGIKVFATVEWDYTDVYHKEVPQFLAEYFVELVRLNKNTSRVAEVLGDFIIDTPETLNLLIDMIENRQTSLANAKNVARILSGSTYDIGTNPAVLKRVNRLVNDPQVNGEIQVTLKKIVAEGRKYATKRAAQLMCADLFM